MKHPSTLVDSLSARTEAAALYKERQDSTDRYIRVSSVAYGLLDRIVAGKNGDRVLGAFYGSLAQQTRPLIRVPDPEVAIREGAERSVALGVVTIHANFESACRDLLSDALEFWPESWEPKLGTIKPPPPAPNVLAKRGWAGVVQQVLRTSSASDGFLAGCYNFLGINPLKGDLGVLPLFDYFRRCRNRFLHQDGVVGSELEEYARRPEVLAAHKLMSPSARRMAPNLPSLADRDLISLQPSHAILFLIVARTLFDAFAARVREKMDHVGYLRMTAHYAYGLRVHPFRQPYRKNAWYPALRFLTTRYRVRTDARSEIAKAFREIGLWEPMVSRFHEIAAVDAK